MTTGAIGAIGPRGQRKRDLLLASRLARAQAIGAFDELAGRIDAVGRRVVQLRAWFDSPWLRIGALAVGTLVLTVRLRRGGTPRVLRWGWLAWRVWRGVAPVVARYRARQRG